MTIQALMRQFTIRFRMLSAIAVVMGLLGMLGGGGHAGHVPHPGHERGFCGP